MSVCSCFLQAQRSLHALALGSPGGPAICQNVLPQTAQADMTNHDRCLLQQNKPPAGPSQIASDVDSMLDKLKCLQQEGAHYALRV